MHRPLDTLYFQWALSEEDKTFPNVFEDITNHDDADKLNDLLGVFAHMTVDVMESEIAKNALIGEYVERAAEDTELLGAVEPDEIAESIEHFPDVLEAQSSVDQAAKRLDLFQAQLVQALTTVDEL